MTSFDATKFQQARLIPTTGIKGALDQERRASSALLAVMRIVPNFNYQLLKAMGAPKGSVETYIEPEFKIGSKKIRPDGLITVLRGKTRWNALVEVKTGKNNLELTQLNSYLDICKEFRIDALVTISNEVLNASGGHPTAGIDQRKLRSTRLEHFSWIRIITEAIVMSEHEGVEDREQDLIMRELVRFLQSDASGASEFNDMGGSWISVREGIKNGSIRKADEDVLQTIANFESLIRYSALTLSARLGVGATEVIPRLAKADYKKHLQEVSKKLISDKKLHGAIEIPGAAAHLEMEADLATGVLHCGFVLQAPKEGRNNSRINWLLRQLKAAPSGTYLSWSYKRSRTSEQPHLVSNLKDKNYDFELAKDKEISEFRLETLAKMGSKRSAGKGGFIDSVVDLFEKVYGDALQPVKPWQGNAPKLSENVKEIIPPAI
jgi:hypothetical protein